MWDRRRAQKEYERGYRRRCEEMRVDRTRVSSGRLRPTGTPGGEWRQLQGEEQLGPFTKEQLRARFGAGVLARDGLVHGPGLADWTPACQVEGLLPPVAGSRPSATPAAGDWYYCVAGETVGPVTLAEVRHEASAGRLSPDGLVYGPLSTSWFRASDHAELKIALPPAAGPGPPPLPSVRGEGEDRAGASSGRPRPIGVPGSEWSQLQGDEQLGPFTREQLRARFGAGALARNGLVHGPGLAQWTPAGEVEGLLPREAGSGPSETSAEWHVFVNGESVGPVTLEELRRDLSTGRFAPDVQVYGPTATDWLRASAYAELRTAMPAGYRAQDIASREAQHRRDLHVAEARERYERARRRGSILITLLFMLGIGLSIARVTGQLDPLVGPRVAAGMAAITLLAGVLSSLPIATWWYVLHREVQRREAA